MLKYLGEFIEKHPWIVLTTVIMVTIGFSTLIPSIEMKTEFEDFMPENEIVSASNRINQYFGAKSPTMFLYMETTGKKDFLNPNLIQQQYQIQKNLEDTPWINNSISTSTFINQICRIEYFKEISNCSYYEIQNATSHLLEKRKNNEILLLDKIDPNELIEYNLYPRILKGRSEDSLDIKKCYVDYNKTQLFFKIEVYDLSAFAETEKKPPLPLVNLLEWYIGFNNQVSLGEEFKLQYKISAQIEPKKQIWHIGEGILPNLNNLFNNIRDRNLLSSYEKNVYLWIKPPSQNIYFPLKLKTGNITFVPSENTIKIKVSREEIGKYGISPSYKSYELPANLNQFNTGVRYYKNPLFKRIPWLRITTDIDFLQEKIEKIQDRPIIGKIAERLLNQMQDIPITEFEDFFNNTEENIPISDQISLKDLENNWINIDLAPDNGTSKKNLFIRPEFYNDIKTGTEGFLSKEYQKTKSTNKGIVILNLGISNGYEETLDTNQEILKKLEEIDNKNSDFKIEATGEGVISYQINQVTSEANSIIMPMIFIIILLVLFISFRKFTYVILPMASLSIATIWLFGTMVLLDIPFTTIAVALVPIILGLGVDYSVHLLHNYRTELSNGKSVAESLVTSVKEIGTAMFLAMLTTVIAFLSFLTSETAPIRDFGILLALGIIYTFLSAITFLAATRYLLDRRKKKLNSNKKQIVRLNVLMGKLAEKILHHKKKIITTLLMITVVTAIAGTQINSGFNFKSFIPEDNPAIETFEKIEREFPYSQQEQEQILYEGNIATVEVLKAIKKTHENLQDNNFIAKKADGSLKTESIYLLIKQAVDNNNSLIQKFDIDEKTYIPETKGDVLAFFLYLNKQEEYRLQFQNLVHKNQGGYDATVVRIYINIISEGRETESLQNDIRQMKNELQKDLVETSNVKVTVTGMMIISNVITNSITEDQMISTGISILLATIVLILAYKRLSLGLIAIIPVGISMIWILGTMYIIGYSLNILTVTVTSITIGIGIDYAIHTTERFRLVADKTGDIQSAVCKTISHTGGALLIAALTTALGFSMLILAPIPPQVQFGVITTMTIVYSFINSVLLLPLILAKWAKWSKKSKGFIISKEKKEKDKDQDTNDPCL